MAENYMLVRAADYASSVSLPVAELMASAPIEPYY